MVIASKRPVALICSKDRSSPFPFDVQHRTIITYSRESPQDFAVLRGKITESLMAIIKKEERLGRAVDPASIAQVEGLSQHEMVALVAVAENVDKPEAEVAFFAVRQDMVRSGYRRIAVTLALASLLEKGFLDVSGGQDIDGNRFTFYAMTDRGLQWLQSNRDKLELKGEAPTLGPGMALGDEEIPF